MRTTSGGVSVRHDRANLVIAARNTAKLKKQRARAELAFERHFTAAIVVVGFGNDGNGAVDGIGLNRHSHAKIRGGKRLCRRDAHFERLGSIDWRDGDEKTRE